LGGTNVTKTQIQTMVQKATTLSGIDASATTDPGWSCVVTTNGVVSLTSPPNGTTCADGTQAGRFVQVAATYNYSVIGAGMDFLGGRTGKIALGASMTVRLQ
jgi:hypothetical protein